ncbi:MAG: nucleotide exchange factor GrpE [Candidatus Sumerlaeia bacterium]|nr:nucleotide exchange factor GrpE [Candidatus Sumerlaeia bacterium]
MIRDWLDQWLWRGTFEVECERLDVVGLENGKDIAGFLADHLTAVTEQVENLEQALRRERSPGRGLHTGEPGGENKESSEAEFKRFARSMLPAMDALDRLIEFGETFERKDEVFENWIKAIEALRSRLTKALESIGVSVISSVGLEVDLNVHDVVAVVPAGEFPPNTVVKEQVKGYYFRGKLLRDARVVVAQ